MAFARIVSSALAVVAVVAVVALAPSSSLADGGAPPAASMPAPTDAAPPPAALARPPVINGAIRGTVELTGKVPPRTPLRRDSDPVCAAVEKQSEDLIATKGKLAGVLVRIKNGTAHINPSGHPASGVSLPPAVITQHDCTYEPRVTGVVAGQKVVIKNADATYHNVRATRGDDPVFNLSQPARTPDLVRDDFTKVGDVVSLHCDVHPWMNAFVVVQDHPFFAVTGEDGRFELRNVPSGTYVLEAWHPVLGLRSTKVKVAARPVTAKLRFAAPKKAANAPI
jgi:plastocyanin